MLDNDRIGEGRRQVSVPICFGRAGAAFVFISFFSLLRLRSLLCEKGHATRRLEFQVTLAEGMGGIWGGRHEEKCIPYVVGKGNEVTGKR